MIFKFLKRGKKYPCNHCKHCFLMAQGIVWCNKHKKEMVGFVDTCKDAERMKKGWMYQ